MRTEGGKGKIVLTIKELKNKIKQQTYRWKFFLIKYFRNGLVFRPVMDSSSELTQSSPTAREPWDFFADN